MFLRLACLYILLVGSFGLENGAFEAYMEDFGKAYATEEVEHRRSIFLDNMAAIEKHNEPERSSGYEMGVNQFTDMLPEEIPTGYVKTYRLSNVAVGRRVLNEEDLESIIRTEPVSDLPQTVDWRNHGITTPVKNQHMCGSCWAFATTAVIESHVALATGTLFSLSEQELVSCAPNPLHCGGMGGCSGSTSEIAFEYARTHGMVDEFTFGYDSNHGAKVPCTLTERRMRGGDKQYVKDAVAAIEGWVTLPRNNYTAVMNTVAKLGPLAVTVACSPWVSYQRGIYAGDLETPKETNLNHLVVLEGYGTDEETGEDYWLVRNSWGPTWGEQGYIRLKRDPNHACGYDTTPANGVACTIDDNGNPVDPPNERICGNSGILYDVTLPLGAHLV